MYEKYDKRRLYQLTNLYLTGVINETIFCEDLLSSYDLELDYDTLTNEERKAFSELCEIASRFSEIEKDLKKHPDIYYTRETLHQKILETKEKLKYFFEAFNNQEDIKY